MDLIAPLSPRVRWDQVVRTIVDHKLAIVLPAVLDGEHPNIGVVGQPVAERFGCIVQPCVALLLNHFRSVGDGLLDELDNAGLGLEKLTRGIVALAEAGGPGLIRKCSVSKRNPVRRRGGD
jgi:hypothetical protein